MSQQVKCRCNECGLDIRVSYVSCICDKGDLERFFRDSKIMEIWEGTSEIEKLVIARNILKEYAEAA